MSVLRLTGLLLCCPTLASAQAVLDTPSGAYEVIGLHHWTLGMLQDSLRNHNQSLFSHACAAVLRRELGFPDASVVVYLSGGGRPEKYTEIMLVEPQDSAHVRYLPSPDDSLPDRPQWEELSLILRQNNNLLPFLINYPRVLYDSAPPDSLLRRSPDSERLRARLPAHLSPDDISLATWTIRHDRNYRNVIPALLILGAPTAYPASARPLADAVRSPLSLPSFVAAALLRYLLVTRGMPVEWDAITPSLRAVLDGTNLFAYYSVSSLLDSVAPPPAHGRALLHGGAHILLARLGAQDTLVTASAHRLLQHLTGLQLPAEPEVWRRALDGE